MIENENMENKKYQIFVSSTYKDLIEARDKVMETILNLYHFPVGMEMFSADDSEQWEIIKDSIDVSDYYVVIIGHRYGSMTSDGIGYTEKEYDYAKEKGIPILAFIRDRNASTKPDERETSQEANAKLEAFIEKASSNKMCDYWNSIEDLSVKIAIALPKTFSRKPQIGWVRGNTAASKELAEELAKLSQENRELRERVAELEAEISKDKPSIEVLLNSSTHLDLDIPSKFPSMIEHLPEFLNINDIPEHLKEYVSEVDIDNFNQKIPSQEVIAQFNDEQRLQWLLYSSSALKISVINNGSCKANDINITIKFPDAVLVSTPKNAKEQSKALSSPLPLSPIEKAESELQKKVKEKKRGIQSYLEYPARFEPPILPNFQSPFDRLSKDIADLNKTQWIDVEENAVKIRIQSLLHTQQCNFDNHIVLIPLKEGNSNAEIHTICEEFREEETMQLELEIRTN